MKVCELLSGEALWLMVSKNKLNVTVRFRGLFGETAVEVRFPLSKGEKLNADVRYFGQPVIESKIQGWSCNNESEEAELRIEACVDEIRTENCRRREVAETAMCIMETYDDLCAENAIDVTAADGDSMERLGCFYDWAEEFEGKYRDDERYADDFLNLVREFAEEKIKNWK